jgi:hypothetical protein
MDRTEQKLDYTAIQVQLEQARLSLLGRLAFDPDPLIYDALHYVRAALESIARANQEREEQAGANSATSARPCISAVLRRARWRRHVVGQRCATGAIAR